MIDVGQHPDQPTENGHRESFNSRLRDECLNVNQFLSFDHAKQILKAWRFDYNHRRPHGALGHLSPTEYVDLHTETRAANAMIFQS